MPKIIKQEELTGAEQVGKIVYAYIGGFFSATLGALIAWPVWNGIVAGITHLPELTYWQCWGAILIMRIIWPSNPTSWVLREYIKE